MLWEWLNSGTQVFILDLDGTLIPSAEIDNECFWQAVFACFGIRGELPDLHDFKHVTDSGILDEWCRRQLGRPPDALETGQIKRHFEQLLESAYVNQPGHFRPLAGVEEWLETATANNRVYTAIATGGWQHSARLKLKLSGLDRFGLPLASSDDAVERTQIMQIAAKRALPRQADDGTVFTYVGDGDWDLKASRELNWNFVGIASGPRAERLKLAGADVIRANFCKL